MHTSDEREKGTGAPISLAPPAVDSSLNLIALLALLGRQAKAAATQHVLRPVTVMPRKGSKRQEYVDVSSSDSEQQQQDHHPQPQSHPPQPAIPSAKQSRTRIQPKKSAPPPVRSPSPVPRPAPPPPRPAQTKRPEPSSHAPRSRVRKRPQPVLETYAHTVHVSRDQVEHEWILLSAPLRAHLRCEVEQVAK